MPSPKATCGSTTPQYVLSNPRSRMRMKSGRMAVAAETSARSGSIQQEIGAEEADMREGKGCHCRNRYGEKDGHGDEQRIGHLPPVARSPNKMSV